MSYLAMSAASFDASFEQQQQQQQQQLIAKKRNSHAKTQKHKHLIDNDKVKSVLQSIHNQPIEEDADLALGSYYSAITQNTGNHSFPDKPISMGTERTIRHQQHQPQQQQQQQEGMRNQRQEPMPYMDDKDDLSMQDLQQNFMNESQVKEYYKKMQSQQHQQQPYAYRHQASASASATPYGDGGDNLMHKLNYIINLLEEQQDQKTGSATEEIVLYSFLGIFIIFVVDSFVKVGRYVR